MANYLTPYAMDWPQAAANACRSNRCERFNRDCLERIPCYLRLRGRAALMGPRYRYGEERLSAPWSPWSVHRGWSRNQKPSNAALKRRSSTVLLETEMGRHGAFSCNYCPRVSWSALSKEFMDPERKPSRSSVTNLNPRDLKIRANSAAISGVSARLSSSRAISIRTISP